MINHRRAYRTRIIFCATIITFVLCTYNYHLANWNWKTLTVHFSSPKSPTIPRNLWYKTGPKGLTNQTLSWISSCLVQNPTYTSSILTDTTDDQYIQTHFSQYPEIIKTYTQIPIPILKADLLRYLILWAEGGIWNDLDVSCFETPIDNWIPQVYKQNATLVVGWEFDVGWGNNFVREFASWTIMAKPKSKHLKMVIDDILEAFGNLTREHGVEVEGLNYTMVKEFGGDVVDFTGPRRFTGSVMKSLERQLNRTIDVGTELGNLTEPKLLGDVLVLPGYAFAWSSNRYQEEDMQGPRLVEHHFAGSWKNDHGGEEV